MDGKIIERRPYMHFKGRLYYVHSLAIDSETREEIVVYQALYPPYGYFTRSLAMFTESVEGRPDNVRGQKRRFEIFSEELI